MEAYLGERNEAETSVKEANRVEKSWRRVRLRGSIVVELANEAEKRG